MICLQCQASAELKDLLAQQENVFGWWPDDFLSNSKEWQSRIIWTWENKSSKICLAKKINIPKANENNLCMFSFSV